MSKGPCIPIYNFTEPINLKEQKKPKTANLSKNIRRYSDNDHKQKENILTEENRKQSVNNSTNNFKNFESKLKINSKISNIKNERFDPELKRLNTADNIYKQNNKENKLKEIRKDIRSNVINNIPNNLNNKIDNNNNNNNIFAFQSQCAKEYERMIKTSHQNRRTSHIINSREVNYKMLESDIFFFKNTNEEKKNFYKEKKDFPSVNPCARKEDPLDSDIFMQKNNEKSIRKIGEKSLLTNRNLKEYHNSQKSNSEWSPKKLDFKSYVNHHSCEYDIVKPNVINKVYTKNTLLNDANGKNPAKRQKGLSEFNDLARIGMSNQNKELVGAFKNNEKIFLKNEQMCNDYLNLHKKYENIVNKPF